MIKPTKPGRANRIADQIQRDVAELIQKEVSNPKTGLVTLTGCEITPDYAHATIYFTSIGSTPEEATEAFEQRSSDASLQNLQAFEDSHRSSAAFCL